MYAYINIILVFFLGAAYSFIELLNIFNTARSFFKTCWGTIYICLNGFLSVLALVLTFKEDVCHVFLGLKILITATSALALVRVIIVPIKNGTTGNNIMPMIDIILDHVKKSYDREISKFDLSDIKLIMKDIDFNKAAEALPVLCSNLLRTLKEEDGKKMNEEIQKLSVLEEGVKEIKAINLGIIMAKYIGIELLRNTVNDTKEFISVGNADTKKLVNSDDTKNDLDYLIEKFS